MSGTPVKYYSVYEVGTDHPLIIHGRAKECAERLGLTMSSFYTIFCKQRGGHRVPVKYAIYEDEPIPEEDLQ